MFISYLLVQFLCFVTPTHFSTHKARPAYLPPGRCSQLLNFSLAVDPIKCGLTQSQPRGPLLGADWGAALGGAWGAALGGAGPALGGAGAAFLPDRLAEGRLVVLGLGLLARLVVLGLGLLARLEVLGLGLLVRLVLLGLGLVLRLEALLVLLGFLGLGLLARFVLRGFGFGLLDLRLDVPITRQRLVALLRAYPVLHFLMQRFVTLLLS